MKGPSYERVQTREEEPELGELELELELEPELELGGDEGDEGGVGEDSSLLHKTQYMAALSLPVCVSFFLFSLSNFILMYYAGHLEERDDGVPVAGAGPVTFAGISLANMYINVSGFALLTGMSTAVETVASQQNGAQRYEDVGVTLLRCLLVLGVLAIPIAATWYFAEPVFLLLGVDEAVCVVMRGYLRVRLFSLPADVVNLSFSKYLMAMGVMRPPMFAAIIVSVVLGVTCWVVTAPRWGVGAGAEGLAWAFVFSTYVGAFSLVFISWSLMEVKRTLRSLLKGTAATQMRIWAVLDLQQLRAFVALGVPGCAMICSEWWAFEILTVFASRLGPVEVSAQSIMLQLSVLSFMLPLGISIATSSMVGNALGANKKRLAIELSHTSLGIILALEICIIGPLILWQGPSFVAVFTEDPEVKLLASKTVHLLAFLVVGDGMQGVAGGILRGAGKQLTGAVTNVFCYYCLGLPVAWFLCFHNDMGVGGLLLGISLGAATQCVVLVCLVLFRESWMFEPVESCTIKGTPQSSRTVDFTEGDVNSIILTDRELELVRMLEQNDLNP